MPNPKPCLSVGVRSRSSLSLNRRQRIIGYKYLLLVSMCKKTFLLHHFIMGLKILFSQLRRHAECSNTELTNPVPQFPPRYTNNQTNAPRRNIFIQRYYYPDVKILKLVSYCFTIFTPSVLISFFEVFL